MNSLLASIVTEAWFELTVHKARSFMTMLGIAWGIAMVVVFLALASGVEEGIIGSLGEFGRDIIIIRSGTTSKQVAGQLPGKLIQLEPGDASLLRRQARLIDTLSVEVTEERVYQYGSFSLEAPVCAVEPEYATLRSMQLASGVFLTNDDLREQRRVVVLGHLLKERLFRQKPAVGQDIRIGGVRFTVVGVLKEKQTMSRFGGPDNRRGFIPFTTADRLMNTQKLSAIIVQPLSSTLHAQAITEVRRWLSGRHHFSPADKKAIEVYDFVETVNLFKGLVMGIKGVNIFLGVLTLVIGGVGVMNVMLVAVTERTREIGIRKAIGARQGQILVQFLMEGLVITLAAGVGGILLGVLLCNLIPPVSMPVGQAQLNPDVTTILTAFGILVAVGLSSGMFPAIKAARLRPVEALRYE